jgi:anaerobic ribonucleoside-triphosphate reductase activating protein
MKTSENQLLLHGIIPETTTNGPGRRFGIWFQGCSRGCPGCFNPETHPFIKEKSIDIGLLVEKIRNTAHIEGVSVSGGEPFEQPEALYLLLNKIRTDLNLSTLVFTGYTLEELKTDEKFQNIISRIDVLVAGAYNAESKTSSPLISSSNQKIHLLSDRYNYNDVCPENSGNYEIIIDKTGVLTITGTGVDTL